MMEVAYIGIGSNLGDRKKTIELAIEHLRGTSSIIVEDVSSIYETDPVGGLPQGKFLNGVIRIRTELSPRVLLTRLKEIERELGREKTVRFGPRVIDLDILTYGNLNINEEDLTIPHPRMNERSFVLRGLMEVKYRHCEEPRRGDEAMTTIKHEDVL